MIGAAVVKTEDEVEITCQSVLLNLKGEGSARPAVRGRPLSVSAESSARKENNRRASGDSWTFRGSEVTGLEDSKSVPPHNATHFASVTGFFP